MEEMMGSSNGPLKIFSGRANLSLAEKIALASKTNLGKITIKNFADGEIWVKFEENIRGCDVFLVQPTPPPADNILELLIMIDAARRASAKRITAVIPYYGYARQDRKDQPRVAISAKLVADLITKAGADRVLTLELHADQIQGFFDIPLDNLYTGTELIKAIKKLHLQNYGVASPDIGSIKRGRSFSRRLGTDLTIINKERDEHNQCSADCIIGAEVAGKNILVVDDLVDTAGTLRANMNLLAKNQVDKIYIAATHAVLSKNAWENLNHPKVEKIFLCDTLAFSVPDRLKRIVTIVSVGGLLADAIKRIHTENSISDLFPEKRNAIS